MDCFRLCGGIFFLLLTIAKRDKSSLDTGESITEKEILQELFKIATSEKLPLSKYDPYNYKTCRLHVSVNLQTDKTCKKNSGIELKKRMDKEYAICLSEMKCFIEKYIVSP